MPSGEIITAFGVLTSVIGVLWLRLEYVNRRVEKKLDKCENDRAELWKELYKQANNKGHDEK